MDLISIIVPVYNVEKYIHECVDSIINQTYKNIEIILVDDGSPDNCGKICDEYAEKDSRIKVIHKENGGLSDARNAGVAVADSEWISFVDSDDIIHPQAIELLFSALKKEKTDIATAMMADFEDGKIPDSFYSELSENYTQKEVNEEFLLEIFKDSRYHSACNRIINKKLLLEFPFAVGRYHEDSPVISKMLHFSQRIVVIPHELYFYRNNHNSITRSTLCLRHFDLLWAWDEQIAFFKTLGYNKMVARLNMEYVISVNNLKQKTQNSKNNFVFRFFYEKIKCVSKIIYVYYSNLSDELKNRLYYYAQLLYPKLTVVYYVINNKLLKRR